VAVPKSRRESREGQRGVALITVILVLLILTALGMAASVMMTQEDRTSSRMEMRKGAFYVAEAGLRQGEQVLRAVTYSNITLNAFLRHASATMTPAAYPEIPQQPTGPTSYDTEHLGTYLTTSPGGGTELSNVEVTHAFSLPGTQRAFYSLYVRNNDDDTAPTVNSDPRIRLIALGWLADPGGKPMAVKILEEEINYVGVTQSPSSQKLTNAGGTGSAQYSIGN
jgi:hypothetical protein